MLEFISENKEWMFSGVGVTAILILWSLFRKKPQTKEIQPDTFAFERHQSVPIISLYTLIPNFILKWRFPQNRVNSSIYIDIRPSTEAIRLNLGELPTCQIWLQVTNHLPFNVVIENIKTNFNYNGCVINVETTDHIDITKHSSSYSVLLEGNLTGEQATHCSKDNASYTSLTTRARISTRFGVFKKQISEVRDINVYVINKRETNA